MKVSFIIQDLFQQGAQYVTALMVKGFIEKGYEVDLLVSKVHRDLLSQGLIPFEVPQKTTIINMPDRKARNNIGYLRSYLKKTDSEAVIVMSSPYELALALAKVGLQKSPKLCYVAHNSLGPEALSRSIKHRMMDFIFNSFVKTQYDVWMAVSIGLANLLESIKNMKHGTFKVVYNPVIDEKYYEKLALQPKCEWLANKIMPTVIAAGAFCEFKGHKTLFEAIKLANKKIPVRLVLFGKGYLRSEYEKWIEENNMKDRILLPGHTNCLPAEMKAADAFIISSLRESFSVVLVEALAANTPIISTDCPYGPPELLKNGEYGTLIPVNDPCAMSEAIVNQVQKPHSNVPKESWEKFTVDHVVEAYEKAIGLI